MSFQALIARQNGTSYDVKVEELDESAFPLSSGVTIDVAYSSLNYKDALAITGRGRIVRRFPMVLGIDLAGTVAASDSSEFKPGDRVIAVGQGLGETEWGGYTQRARVAPGALVHLPEGMSLEQSMQIGTAGFTAMLCVIALQQNGITATAAPMVVTGAAGGVGSIAVMLLASAGYEVAAATGRRELEEYLRTLGARQIIDRSELATSGGPLQSERWGGAIDTVGGQTLATLFAQTRYGGAIACCGMAGGHELNTTVWPLILRNVSLLGISSIHTPHARRVEAWSRLARELDFSLLASVARTEPLSRIHALAEEILAARIRGRVVVDVNG